MPFRDLPAKLRLYIVLHAPVLALALFEVLREPRVQNLQVLGLVLCATLFFSVFKVELAVFHGRITPTFAVECLALLMLGGPAAVLCAAMGAAFGTFVRPVSDIRQLKLVKPPPYVVFFNVANTTIACAVGALAHRAVVTSMAASGLTEVVSLASFTTAYFGINSLGVARAIAWQKKLRFYDVWQDKFLWTGLGFFASASIAAGIQAAVPYIGFRSLLLLPLFLLIYHWQRLHLDRLRMSTERFQREMAHVQELNQLNQALITSLATAIDAKDDCTSSHIARVQLYAVALAKDLGLEGPELAAVETGAVVHDIGKIGIPDRILSKPGKLTPDEYRLIQQHVPMGVRILAPVPFPFPVVDVVRSHHERWDGLGYPEGLKGETIPIGGRIVATVDVFDALTSQRPYRRAMTHEEALQHLVNGAGKQFDPHIVERFGALLPSLLAEIAELERLAPASLEPLVVPPAQADGPDTAEVAKVAVRLSMAQDVNELATALTDACIELLPVDTAVFYRRAANDELVAVDVAGRHRERLLGLRIASGEGMSGWVARERRTRHNVPAAGDVARRFGPDEPVELTSATGVAIAAGDRVVGVLSIYTAAYELLTESHRDVLVLLSESCSVALSRLDAQHGGSVATPLYLAG